MLIYLIRHGKTAGNQEKRYIGSTDESLCLGGIQELEEYKSKKVYPAGEEIYTSPMKRCIQTAEILYPNKKLDCVAGLQETNFGMFEGKNYDELKHDPLYQNWLNSGGELPFPGGECKASSSLRCCQAFEKVIREMHTEQAIFIVHGGTIMALLEQYATPQGNYYDYQVKNGNGYKLEVEWRNINPTSFQLKIISRLLEQEEG